MDYHIQNLLKDFKYSKNKELYYGISIDDLIMILDYISDNFDKSIEYINNFIKNKLEISLAKDPIIMEPLNIKSIIYKINDNIEETINIEEGNQKLVKETLFNFLESLKPEEKIRKKDLIIKLNLNISKTDIWLNIKKILNWANSKTPINFNNKEFYILFK